jgi:hypothetical protein
MIFASSFDKLWAGLLRQRGVVLAVMSTKQATLTATGSVGPAFEICRKQKSPEQWLPPWVKISNSPACSFVSLLE